MNREKDTKAKHQRSLSRRAQLRSLSKAIKNLQRLTLLQAHEKAQLVEQNKDLYRRLCETQKLCPFWVRKFP